MFVKRKNLSFDCFANLNSRDSSPFNCSLVNVKSRFSLVNTFFTCIPALSIEICQLCQTFSIVSLVWKAGPGFPLFIPKLTDFPSCTKLTYSFGFQLPRVKLMSLF